MCEKKTLCLLCCILLTLLTIASAIGLAFVLLYTTRDAFPNTSFHHDHDQPGFKDIEATLPYCSEPTMEHLTEELKICGSKKAAIERTSGARIHPPLLNEEQVAKIGHWEGARPLRYDLNLSFSKSGLDFSGGVSILLEAKETVSRIFLNMDTEALKSDIDQLDGVILWKRCSQEIICITKITVVADLQTLIIQPENPIEKGEFFFVSIRYFAGAVFDDWSRNGSLGLFLANKMGRDFAIGTIFQMRYARTVFPCLDHPSLKAKVKFCIRHSQNVRAQSNMPSSRIKYLKTQAQFESCFEKTPILPTYVFTFSLMSKLDVLTNKTKEVEIEVYAPMEESKNLKWIIPETISTLNRMEEMMGRKYDLPRLAFLNIEPTPFWGIENFGLATLDLGWTKYPQYEKAHEILIHEIVHQWVGNLFTIKSWSEICLQEGLTTFLQWILYAELNSDDNYLMQTVAMSIGTAFSLDGGNDTIIRTDFKRTKDIQDRCFSKPPLAFFMLQKIFGQKTMEQFLSEMSNSYFYQNAGLEEWSTVLNKVTNSQHAGKLLKNFFQNPGYPILFPKQSSSREITVVQKVFKNEKRQEISSDDNAFVLPLEVKTSAEENTLHFHPIMSKRTSFTVAQPFTWFVVDSMGASYSRTVYTVRNYLEIVKCFGGSSKCQLSKWEFQQIFRDFCFTLLQNEFPLHEDDTNATRWRQLKTEVNNLRVNNIFELRYPCKCCFMTKAEIEKDLGSFSPGCKSGFEEHCKHLKIMDIWN